MTDENELPKWAFVSKEHLRNIAPKIDAIKKEGQAEIKRGIEKVDKANNLQNETDYLDRLLSQHHDSQFWGDEIVTISGAWLENRLASLDSDLDEILGYAQQGGKISEEYHRDFIGAVSDSDSSAGTAVYLGAGIEQRFLVIEPSYKAILQDFEPKRLTSRDALFQDLKSILEPFGKDYISMVEGSEAALRLATPDSQSQAAHSMRDCYQQLLEYLAPSKVVESQPWFESTAGAPGGVSRRSRLRYILYGSGENVDESTIKQLDDLTDIAKNSLDLCIARAHDHDPSLTKEEIILVVDQARNALLHVINLYNNFRTR
jgi:hypothetical protein